ncbi:MAG TPA: hypothetical protein VLE25_05690 [Nitrospira sp.]|nr:hypothetical protein [Nitrospira sp.]
MNTFRTIKRLVLLSIVMFILVGTVLSVYAEDRLVEGAMILAPMEVPSRMSKVSEDTLTACLTRIPAQMTTQQHMTAQQICQIEETTRQLVPFVKKKGN